MLLFVLINLLTKDSNGITRGDQRLENKETFTSCADLCRSAICRMSCANWIGYLLAIRFLQYGGRGSELWGRGD